MIKHSGSSAEQNRYLCIVLVATSIHITPRILKSWTTCFQFTLHRMSLREHSMEMMEHQ